MKGQISLFVKVISLVLSVGVFIFIVSQYHSYTLKVSKEKEMSRFRLDVLNTLQRLVSKECLAYETTNESIKPVLDAKKIDEFSKKYKDLEPDCAKALGFDYKIEVIQLEKVFKTYPAKKIIEGECEPKNGIAVHRREDAYLFVCSRDLSEEEVREKCCSGSELDGSFPRFLWCKGDLSVYCKPYDCRKFLKSDEECMYIDETTTEKACCIRKTCNAHPWMTECYNINPEEDCEAVSISHIHAWCGNVGTSKRVPIGETTSLSIEKKIWGFAISSGVSSFSPEKARVESVDLSLPITIRYNESFSAEGIIRIKAIKGELEEFYSVLEDVCKKAIDGKPIRLSTYLKLSYPIRKNGNKLCMLDKCKIFVCPLALDFTEIGDGEHVLTIQANLAKNNIEVKE